VQQTRRRAPRYLSFLLSGALLGVLVTAVVVAVRASAVERPELLFFYLGIVLGGVGALLGGLVAVALESRSHSARRSSP
jgi:uncharacterized membrane protein